MRNLSELAQKLLSALNEKNGGWIGNFADTLFDKPEYPIDRDETKARHYWQWCADFYNTTDTRPVGGKFETFVGTKNYSSQVSSAYQELRRAGLADEKNNGYNEYFIYPTR